jgi:hypothetical protein
MKPKFIKTGVMVLVMVAGIHYLYILVSRSPMPNVGEQMAIGISRENVLRILGEPRTSIRSEEHSESLFFNYSERRMGPRRAPSIDSYIVVLTNGFVEYFSPIYSSEKQ